MFDAHKDYSGGWSNRLALQRERKRKELESLKGITFCGCGFLGIYLVGAACYMQEFHPRLLSKKLGGSSSGSFVAACIACGVPLQKIRHLMLDEVRRVRKTFLGPFNPNYRLEDTLMNSLLELLPEDAHLRASGRVYLSLTKTSSLSCEIVSEYPTRDELIRAILCCCFLPYLSGFSAPVFNGRRYIDGGMSDIAPLEGPSYITVNAFSGNFEICPPDAHGDLRPLGFRVALSQSNLHRLKWGILPPEPEILDQFFHFGYFHARNFFEHGCTRIPRPLCERQGCQSGPLKESWCACAC